MLQYVVSKSKSQTCSALDDAYTCTLHHCSHGGHTNVVKMLFFHRRACGRREREFLALVINPNVQWTSDEYKLHHVQHKSHDLRAYSSTIKVEKYLMSKIYKFVLETFDSHFYDFYSFNSDELIFKQRTPYDFLSKDEAKKMENDIKEKFGIEVRVESIFVRDLNIVNCNLNKVDAYERTNLYTGEKSLKKASTTYYPQIYKIWKGDKLCYEDLVFWTNDQLAVFEKYLMEDKDEYHSK